MRTLSRLKALQAFEAAARHGSFAGAASELNVTPAAVGQLVRSLESALDAKLFGRRRSGAERLYLSEDARAATVDLTAGFDQISRGLKRLRERRTQPVTVTASQAIVARWLLPGLPTFAQANPSIDVRLDVTDRVLDLAAGDADVGVRCGPGNWPGLDATLLMREELVVVCSPELLPGKSLEPSTRWRARQTFIRDTSPATLRFFSDWEAWFALAGLPRPSKSKELPINSGTAAIQAALRGNGLALARLAIVADELARGNLLHLYPSVRCPIDWSYFVVASPAAMRRPEVRAFHTWLIESWKNLGAAKALRFSKTPRRTRPLP